MNMVCQRTDTSHLTDLISLTGQAAGIQRRFGASPTRFDAMPACPMSQSTKVRASRASRLPCVAERVRFDGSRVQTGLSGRQSLLETRSPQRSPSVCRGEAGPDVVYAARNGSVFAADRRVFKRGRRLQRAALGRRLPGPASGRCAGCAENQVRAGRRAIEPTTANSPFAQTFAAGRVDGALDRRRVWRPYSPWTADAVSKGAAAASGHRAVRSASGVCTIARRRSDGFLDDGPGAVCAQFSGGGGQRETE